MLHRPPGSSLAAPTCPEGQRLGLEAGRESGNPEIQAAAKGRGTEGENGAKGMHAGGKLTPCRLHTAHHEACITASLFVVLVKNRKP